MAISIVSPTEPYNPDKEREGGAAYKSMLNDMTEEARAKRNKPNKFTQFMNAAGQVMGMIKDVQGINNAELQRKQSELQLEREKNTTKIQSIQVENELQNLEKDNKWLESFSTYFESQDLDKLHDFALSDISQLSRHPSERNVLIAKLKQAGYDTSVIESVDMDQYNKNQLNNARIFAAYNRGRGSNRSKSETSGLSKEQKKELEFQKNQTVKEAGAFASLAELANNNPEFRQGLADIGITTVDDPIQFYQEFVQKGCQAKIVQTQQGNDTKEASKGTANLNNALLSSKLENLRSNLTNSNTGSSNPATIQLSCNQDDGTRISVEVPADLNSKLPIRTYSGIGESNGGVGDLIIDVNPKNTNLGNILSVVNNSTTRWRKTSDRDKSNNKNTDPIQTNTDPTQTNTNPIQTNNSNNSSEKINTLSTNQKFSQIRELMTNPNQGIRFASSLGIEPTNTNIKKAAEYITFINSKPNINELKDYVYSDKTLDDVVYDNFNGYRDAGEKFDQYIYDTGESTSKYTDEYLRTQGSYDYFDSSVNVPLDIRKAQRSARSTMSTYSEKASSRKELAERLSVPYTSGVEIGNNNPDKNIKYLTKNVVDNYVPSNYKEAVMGNESLSRNIVLLAATASELGYNNNEIKDIIKVGLSSEKPLTIPQVLKKYDPKKYKALEKIGISDIPTLVGSALFGTPSRVYDKLTGQQYDY